MSVVFFLGGPAFLGLGRDFFFKSVLESHANGKEGHGHGYEMHLPSREQRSHLLRAAESS